MAPPFREAKFDIVWGMGISRSGEVLDLAVEAGIVDKSGAWFAYGSEKLGMGRENVRAMLTENVELREEIERKVIEHLGMDGGVPAPSAPETSDAGFLDDGEEGALPPLSDAADQDF